MANKNQMHFLEKGNIYFLYRPKVEGEQEPEAKPENMEDIQRFYMVLQPQHGKSFRLLLLGKKRLPDIKGHEKEWARIEFVTSQRQEFLNGLKEQHYKTKTRGERTLPETRAAGEGVYGIVASGRQTYLVYALELPKHQGEVQEELNLDPEASFVISVKNQEIAGVQGGKPADFPKSLQALFNDRRFIPLEKTDFLDYPNAELLLIGASADVSKKLGIDLKPETESLNTADIFKELKLWKSENTTEPLFKGTWK